MLPSPLKDWLSYGVLGQLKTSVRPPIQTHDVLGPIAAASQNNAWAITPAAMLYLWQLIETKQPQSIIEFGSGQSTRLFAAYAQRMATRGRKVSLLSVEHDERWLEQTRAAIERAGHLDYVQFHLAPLVNQQLLGRTMEAYSLDPATLARAAGKNGFGVCFIDGPSGTVGRAGCLPLVADYLAENACVLLDDALREGEQAVVARMAVDARPPIRKFARIQMLDRHGMLHLTWKRSHASSNSRTILTSPRTQSKADRVESHEER